jgi:hypothetical protein
MRNSRISLILSSLQSQYPSMMIDTWHTDSLNTLSCYRRILPLQNSWYSKDLDKTVYRLEQLVHFIEDISSSI